MKKKYNFTDGVRGKFYKENLSLNSPVYLEPDIQAFVEKIAKEKKSDTSTIVNKLLKENIKIAQVLK